MESKKHNKLQNKTERKQTHRYRKQTSDYQWGEERWEGQYRGRGKRVIMDLYEIMCVKVFKPVKHYRNLRNLSFNKTLKKQIYIHILHKIITQNGSPT